MAMNYQVNRDIKEVKICFGDQIISRKLQKNEDGKEFFAVPNLLNHPEKTDNQFFYNRIKDAIDTIRNGDGDTIAKIKPFGVDAVIRYLDRDYGKSIRNQFLENWKNTKFAHLICIRIHWPLDANGNINVSKPNYFETQEQAEKYLSDISEKMSKIVADFNAASSEDSASFLDKGNYSYAEKEMFTYLLNKATTGSAEFPFTIIQTLI